MVKFAFLISIFAMIGCERAADIPTLEKRMDGLFSAYAAGIRPGYAIGIIREGRLIFEKGYGLADLNHGIPITPDTPFNLASLSKQFTGAAIALVEEQNSISLDDQLADYWPNLPEFMSEIEIGHLVYMTSGLKEYYTLPSPKGGWLSEDQFTIEDAVEAVFASGQLNYEPGTRWSYSNINFQLLAVLVGRLTNTPFPEFLEASLFRPLKMENSWIDASLQSQHEDSARNYNWSDEENSWIEAPRLSPHYGGSGMFSSIRDLAKWDKALYKTKILGEEFSDRMLATRQYDHDKDNDGYGLIYGSYQGLKTIWYEGGDYGVSTYMVRLPERDETIICLSNFGHGRCAEKARMMIDILIAFESK